MRDTSDGMLGCCATYEERYLNTTSTCCRAKRTLAAARLEKAPNLDSRFSGIEFTSVNIIPRWHLQCPFSRAAGVCRVPRDAAEAAARQSYLARYSHSSRPRADGHPRGPAREAARPLCSYWRARTATGRLYGGRRTPSGHHTDSGKRRRLPLEGGTDGVRRGSGGVWTGSGRLEGLGDADAWSGTRDFNPRGVGVSSRTRGTGGKYYPPC